MADRNIELKLKDVRLSFPHLFEPQENENDKGDPTYSFGATLLLNKETQADQIKMIQEAMKKAIAEKWPDGKTKIPPERRCLRDGEPADPDTGERNPLYEGYEGCVYLSCRRPVKSAEAKSPIQVIGPRKNRDGKFPRLTEDEVYGGCYVNAIVRIYAYDGTKNKNPNRVNATLEVCQFKRAGEAFGAKAVDADAAMDEDEDSDDVVSGSMDEAGASAVADDDDDMF